jgi:hypothetical protein
MLQWPFQRLPIPMMDWKHRVSFISSQRHGAVRVQRGAPCDIRLAVPPPFSHFYIKLYKNAVDFPLQIRFTCPSFPPNVSILPEGNSNHLPKWKQPMNRHVTMVPSITPKTLSLMTRHHPWTDLPRYPNNQ